MEKANTLVYGSVCSGIEAATVAWHPLGFTPAWFSEIEPFPGRVLAHHYPNVPNLGDMTKLSQHTVYNETAIDLLVGGTPCQSFSIAGLRGGLDDERGNLALEYCRILIAKQPRWFVWENVPGVFSSFSNSQENPVWVDYEDGRDGDRANNPDQVVWETADFAAILKAFQECGYSCAWRVLDAQYFGVPQRRRRVFVVGRLGNDWRPPFAVLFERQSLRRDFTPRREAGQETATAAGGGAKDAGPNAYVGDTLSKGANQTTGFTGDYVASEIVTDAKPLQAFNLQRFGEYVSNDVSHTLIKRDYKDATDLIVQIGFTPTTYGGYAVGCGTLKKNGGDLGGGSETIIAFGAQNSHTQGDSVGDISPSLDKSKVPGVTYSLQTIQVNMNGSGIKRETRFTLNKNDKHSVVPINEQIITRSEKLGEGTGFGMGENNDPAYTLQKAHPHGIITNVARRLTPLECERLQGFPDNYTNIPKAKDAPRYAALGNSMAVPVMRWLGERIQMVDEILKKVKPA
jgi:DNA (cytosine-5)-methyltransferase 1